MLRISTHRPVCNHNSIILAKRRNVIAYPQICYYQTAYSTKDSNVKSVAVLGGGITGLTTAFYLSKKAPGLPVTIYESSPRLGGWLRTKNLNTKFGNVEFETGPRTIRPFGLPFLVTMDMIGSLGLGDSTILVTKYSKGAMYRYVYYPDKLNRLPSTVRDIFPLDNSSGLYEGLWRGILGEIFTPGRPIDLTDESVGSWVSRRIHPKVSENLFSAMIHGIYAGDVDKLSMKSLFPYLWREEGESGSVLRGGFRNLFRESTDTLASDVKLRSELEERTRWGLKYLKKEGAVLLRFIGGIETFVTALERYLEKAPNIRIRTNSTVKALNEKKSSIKIQLANNLPPTTYSHVISTLPAPITSSLLPTLIPSLSTAESVTVQVVNLYFPNPLLLPMRGFGYLIPKSVPLEMNPEQGLGVIFDSETSPISLDHPHFEKEAIGTKLTVMMGGHYWDGRTTYPSDDEAVKNALSLLQRHLGIFAHPAATFVSTQKDCIPQYTVGHHSRMAFAHEQMKMYFKGRVAVAGSSYSGVGMNDCARSGYEAARDLLEMGKPGGLADGEWTGLSKFVDEKMLQVKKTKNI